jgi:signal transduction histidine kinase
VADRTLTHRAHTDGSLCDERSKTDQELAKRRAIVERDADAVVSLAQRRADEVLALARERADRAMQDVATAAAEMDRVEKARAAEDDVLANERSAAREELEIERAARAEIVSELLLLERMRTDEHLASERAAADAALVARDDVLGVVSHDLRTQLHAIGLGAELILCDIDANVPVTRIREHAVRNLQHVARTHRLLGDLLDLAAIDAGKLRVEPSKVDAAELARETVNAFQPLAVRANVALVSEVTVDRLPARLDRERILQVLGNLVTNAMEFTDAGGRVTVSVRGTDGGVRFAVRDTGRGIASDRLSTIFDRFAQASSDRRGVGLGLYISRSIVEAHRGRLSVESLVGEGSEFAFELPS